MAAPKIPGESSLPSSPGPENQQGPAEQVRRDFLFKCASAVFAGLVVSGGELTAVAQTTGKSKTAAGSAVVLKPLFEILGQRDEDVLIRMQRELSRALEKPMRERRWGMVIDTRRCVACHSCTVGCVMENKLPPGVVYRPVIDTEVGTYPNVTRKFLPRPCLQCDDPPCVPVCPVTATWKREDGITVIDYKVCIGCRYCITACPYQARTFDFGENWTGSAAQGRPDALALGAAAAYEKQPNFEYEKEWRRKQGLIPESPVGNTRKCHFCAHRLAQGMLPMCVTTCIGRATFFGDLNDSGSLVSELITQTNAIRLKEELATEPKVYYLV